MTEEKKKRQRIKVKGHYRVVERDERGRFLSVDKWSSASVDDLETILRICRRIQQKYLTLRSVSSIRGNIIITTRKQIVRL